MQVGERIESCGLAQALAQYHRRRQRDIERAGARLHGDAQPDVGRVVDVRNTGAFAAEQQRIAGLERHIREGRRARGGEQDQAAGPR